MSPAGAGLRAAARADLEPTNSELRHLISCSGSKPRPRAESSTPTTQGPRMVSTTLNQLAGMVSTGAGAFSPVSASVIRIRRNVKTPLDLRSRFSIQYQRSP